MNPERFFEYYQPGEHLNSQIQGAQERMGTSKDPVIFLADTLVEYARQEMKELSDREELVILSENSPQFTGNGVPQVTAIIFGTAIKSLSECLSTGYFEHDTFRSRLNNTLTDTPIAKNPRPHWLKNESEVIPLPKFAAAKNQLIHDPTYSFFFEEPILMPESLRKYLEEKNFFKSSYLKGLTLSWKEIVGSLNLKSLNDTEVPAQSQSLIKRERYMDEIAQILDRFEF